MTNENDENSVSTRVTRAKAAALGDSSTDLVKKGLTRTKSAMSTTNAAQARKRAALGDLSNVNKDMNIVKDGKKKALSNKSSNSVAKPTGIEKRTAPAKQTLQPKKLISKRPATESVIGHAGKIRVAETSTTKIVVQQDEENVEPAIMVKKESVRLVEDVELLSEITDVVDATERPANVPDLDAEDLDDPLMVAEYVGEIFEYLLQLQEQTMANADYMSNQPDLEWQMRGILMDWLLEVHTRFRLLPETLFLAVNIIDRFLSAKIVQLDRLQLVGVTAMFIASKYEEVLSPHVSNFRHVADDGFTEEEILSAERFVLGALNYDLSYPNPMNFLRRISKADNYDVQTRTLGKYLMEISCLDHRFIGHPPHRIAASAMYLARLVLDRGAWDDTIAHYAGCTEEELLPCFYLMIDYLHGPVKHDAFFKKYAHKKFMKGKFCSSNHLHNQRLTCL
jgi:hypothetical protein